MLHHHSGHADALAFAAVEFAAQSSNVNIQQRAWTDRINDPVGEAIHAAVQSSPPSLRGELQSHLLALINTLSHDQPISITSIPANLKKPIVQALATYAAYHLNSSLLSNCLSHGADIHKDLPTVLALESNSRTPSLLDVLYIHNWRNLHTDHSSFQRNATWSLHTNPDELLWFLHMDPSLDIKVMLNQAVREHSLPVKAACVGLVLDRFEIGMVQGVPLLQDAARRGNVELVTLLLQKGVAVDELVVGDETERRKYGTALYEAVDRGHETVAELLLQYGADPMKNVRGGMSPLELAGRRGLESIESTLRRAVAKREERLLARL